MFFSWFVFVIVSVFILSCHGLLECQRESASGSNSRCDDDGNCISWKECSSGHPIMTDCGFSSNYGAYSAGGNYYDSFNDECESFYKEQHFIPAKAVCCKSDLFDNIIRRSSGWSGTNNDASTTVYCQSGEVVLGCFYQSESGRYDYADGSYFGTSGEWQGVNNMGNVANKLQFRSEACTARKGQSSSSAPYSVRAHAMCGKIKNNKSVQCKSIWSDRSGTNDDNRIEATCPSNTEITGCSVYSPWGNFDGSWIDGNKCIAQNGNSGNGVWAIANCCIEF